MQTRQRTVWILSVVVMAAGFAFSSAGFVLAEVTSVSPESVAAASEAPAGQERQVVLYYFHGARRCKTCLSMEANALAVVESEFAAAVDSGALVWKVVNYDEPENDHFIKDFKLVSSSLVLVETQGGEQVRFSVLHDAWSLARDEWRFKKYVQKSVRDFLDRAS
jgi:hypothetical protein